MVLEGLDFENPFLFMLSLFYINKLMLIDSIYRNRDPPRNPVIEKFFQDFPKCNMFKFLIDHRKHRLFYVFLFKKLYWLWFKTLNRIQLREKQNCRLLQKDYKGEPFLIVENHSLSKDVLMHMAVWAHLGMPTYVFTFEGSFSVTYPLLPVLTHFVEMVPRYGTGQSSVLRMVRRLEKGDIVNIYPAGTYPSGKFANSGLVQEGFSGAARVAYTYWQRTGKKLTIQPVCSLGGNVAYPPRLRKFPIRTINHQIIVKFGEPFTLDFSAEPDYLEIKAKTEEIQLNIAKIWGQKKLIPNYSKVHHRNRSGGEGKPRIYTSHKKSQKKKNPIKKPN